MHCRLFSARWVSFVTGRRDGEATSYFLARKARSSATRFTGRRVVHLGCDGHPVFGRHQPCTRTSQNAAQPIGCYAGRSALGQHLGSARSIYRILSQNSRRRVAGRMALIDNLIVGHIAIRRREVLAPSDYRVRFHAQECHPGECTRGDIRHVRQ